jgi:uncharacterized protein
MTSDDELDALQAELDRIPAPLQALDICALDGFLCAVLLQPRRVNEARWMPHVFDVDGRPLPQGFDSARLCELVRKRYALLDAAIERRSWFDPWVFELDEEPQAMAALGVSLPVSPWVAGFATALDLFPQLSRMTSPAVLEALALLYRHLDPDDLEEAEELLEEIESLEPVNTLAEAVEDLVSATLLLADQTRPLRR